MKIFYDHQYGKIETQNLQISNIYASDVLPEEEEHALDVGFLNIEENLWFNCRSTRITPYPINAVYSFVAKHVDTDLNIEKYLLIYDKFISNKKFNPIIEDKLFLKRDSVIEYYQDNELVGFSKIRNYTDSVELCLHCHIQNSDFSYQTLLYEIDYFKNKKYIYLGPGYEKSSIYKSKLNNFEWFNGKEWSSNKTVYSELCENDSSLQVTTSL